MHSTTREELVEEVLEAMEEVEDLVEVVHRLSATTMDKRERLY